MIRTTWLGAALALALGCHGSSPGRRAAQLSGMDLDGIVTLQDALAAAQAEVPDGIAIGAQLEIEDDDEVEPAAWEVSFFVPGDDQVIEVEIDASSGDVLEVEIEEDAGEQEDDDD